MRRREPEPLSSPCRLEARDKSWAGVARPPLFRSKGFALQPPAPLRAGLGPPSQDQFRRAKKFSIWMAPF